MIFKTAKVYKRFNKTWLTKSSEQHLEVVLHETWWLLIIPLYVRETVCQTTI